MIKIFKFIIVTGFLLSFFMISTTTIAEEEWSGRNSSIGDTTSDNNSNSLENSSTISSTVESTFNTTVESTVDSQKNHSTIESGTVPTSELGTDTPSVDRQKRAVQFQDKDNRMIYTPSKNEEDDYLKGGNISINTLFTVAGTDVAYNAFLMYHVGFKITWSVPEGISPQQFINSIDLNNTKIFLGEDQLKLKKTDFHINREQNVEFIANDNSLDIFSIVGYLISLIFGKSDANIRSSLSLKVNEITKDFKDDKSKNKIVTKGKIPPSINNKLASTVKIYDRNYQFKKQVSLEMPTWSTYISPWNSKESLNDLNGKNDDTQMDGSLEVLNINRVLYGSDYKSREVNLPIAQDINPKDYIRVVNLFNKKLDTKENVSSDLPLIKNEIEESEDTTYLNRTSTYWYRGSNRDILISPVPIRFIQKTYLRLKVKKINQYPEDKKIPIEGESNSEGEKCDYYFSIDHGEKNFLDNKSGKQNKLDGELPPLSQGIHTITIGVKNEFNLVKEVSFDIDIIERKLTLKSVPTSITFGKAKLSYEQLNLKGNTEGELIVSNTRENQNWKLSLRQNSPLINNKIEMNYVNRENQVIQINNENQPIEHNQPDNPEEDRISSEWQEKNRGVFLKIPTEFQKVGKYSSELVWTLQDVPKAQ